MADFSITITNQFELFAGEPPSLWNELIWGTDDWGYNEGDIIHLIGKIIEDASTFTTANNFDIVHFIDDNTLNLDSEIITALDVIIEEINFGSLSLTSRMDDIFLQDSEGFYHVFKGNTTDGSDRVVSVYTEVTHDFSNWSEVTSPTTPWS